MKKRIIAFLLCFALVMPVLPAFAVTTEDITLSATSVTLPQYEKKTITAAPGANVQVSAYQWQIKVPGTDLWVDISGAKGATLELSYAMVASLLQGDQAQIRCEAVIGGETVETEVVTVTMDYTSEPAVVTESEPVEPKVLTQATVVESSVSAPASNAKQEETVEDDSDLAALEEARNAAITAEGEAEAAVAAAQNKLTAAQNAEAAAKAALDQAQADYDAAVAAAAPAETEAEDAETEAEDAETTEAAPAVTVDSTARDAAEAAYADAQNATADAQKELDEANAALTVAQAKTADAQKAYEAAEAETATTAMAAFSTTRRTSSAVMMADADVELNEVYTITIQYILAGTNKQIADPHIAQVIEGQSYKAEVESPKVAGYTAEQPKCTIDIPKVTQSETYIVNYNPADVEYKVVHKQQTLDLSGYIAVETEDLIGKTGSIVAAVPKDYEGFTYLLYKRPTIAADGSTVVEIKYDRVYTLVNFDLGGGYGVEPIYAPYGSNIGNVGTPVLAGYSFKGWSLDGTNVVSLPSTIPANNVTYKAVWEADATAKVTIVFWGENADDEEYSYYKSAEVNVKPGTEFTYNEDGSRICGQEAHVHDESCGYTCGETAHSHDQSCYTLTCTQEVHSHMDACYICNLENHTHSTSCYAGVGDKQNIYTSLPDSTSEGLVYDHWYYNKIIYIKGSWYSYNGSTSANNVAPTTCGKSESTHTHTDACLGCGKTAHTHTEYTGACYSLTCTITEHVHGDDCGYNCGKTAHTHDDSCYMSDAGMDSSLWKFVNSDTVKVKADGSSIVNVYYDRVEYTVQFHTNQNCTNEYTSLRITAKWGENILDQWPTYNGSSSWLVQGKSNTWQNSIQIMPVGGAKFWGPLTGNNSYSAYYYVEALPGDSDTIVHNGVTYKLHHTDISVSSGNVTDEERYGIEGFTYKEGTANGQSYTNAKFYYTRNSYNLVFNDGFNDVKSETVKYEAPLSGYADFVPDVPSAYEPGSVVFDGWYLNPECSGDEYDLTKHTMPADNILLYAKWAPVTHEVKIFLTETNADNLTNQLGETQEVDHRATATEPDESVVVNPESAYYEFVGWFYKENGEEKAFDFSMGVTKDLVLYAKWSTDVEKQFVIYYKIYGTDTEIADRTTGSGPVGSSETFEAKFGDDLNIGYQDGYFPTLLSHNITLNIKDNDNEGAHQYTFWYKKTTVPYTVRYLDKNTKEPLLPDKVVTDNTKSYVTETFAPVTGKVPDAYQKSLRLIADTTAEENVIIFYYEVDENRAYYAHTHWIKDINGEWNRISSNQAIGNVGELISAEPRTDLSNYTYDPDLTELVVGDTVSPYTEPEELTFNGLEIRHYYVENEVDLNYVAVGPEGATGFGSVNPTTEKVAIFTGLATGSTATATENYEFVGWYDNAACEGEAISLEASYVPTRPAEGWVDETTFYAKFEEKEVTINYVVIGPEGCGTVTPERETVKVLTGTAAGSTAEATNNDYKFVGWYSDENCTHQLSKDAEYIPAKIDGKNIATTYYAKFDYNLTTMTITKSLSNGAYDPQDTFIFDVSGSDGSEFVVTLSPADGRSSVTIGNVTVGVTYTVTERAGGGSNRYTATETPEAKALVPNGEENVFAFTNKLTNNKWLTASDVKHNVFK